MANNRARQEIIWIPPKKISKVAKTTGTVHVFYLRSGI
jgi:hypothetical protein